MVKFRFLLTGNRWRLQQYKDSPNEAIEAAVRDLSPGDSKISVYAASLEDEQDVKDYEVLAFLFAATVRQNLSHLHYIDLADAEIEPLGLSFIKEPDEAEPPLPFYKERHYNIENVTDSKRSGLARRIFEKIDSQELNVPPRILKVRFREFIPMLKGDDRITGLQQKHLKDWVLRDWKDLVAS